MKVTIVGGGINGLCSAYYLQKEGYKVEIIDPSFAETGSSYGNAGMIVPSHFVPMASPGVITQGMKWMFDSSSPFYVKPRLDLSLLRWLWKFYRSCNAKNVLRSQELILQYNELSKREYRSITDIENFDVDFKETGLMMLYQNEKSGKEEIEIGEKAVKLGLQTQFLDAAGVQALNPDTEVSVKGGVYYPGDAHIYSNRFMVQMKDLLLKRGVSFINAKIQRGKVRDGKIVSLMRSDGDQFDVDQVVVASGVWSKKILNSLGISISLEDGKGYSITQLAATQRPSIPSILTDEKVAITPMGEDLRITGTLEISGISQSVNQKRVNAFLNAVPKYFPNIKTQLTSNNKEIWTGYRPLSYDGVPYVGRSQSLENLVVATGHGMMGMSLGPGTGKLVSEIILGKHSSLDLELMKIER